MASKPGLLTEWPWKKLGNFKYMIMAPWVAHSLYLLVVKRGKDLSNLFVFPYMLLRLLHGQLWITFSRFQTSTNNHKILNKSIEFQQVDRERNWFHSLHHSEVRTNYSLFMPMYDYLYGTVDKSTDTRYETSLKEKKEMPDVVHLTHPTTLPSIYHQRLGFASLASKPYASRWYLWMIWPITCVLVLWTWISSSIFIVESNKLDKLKMHTWAIPRFHFQYLKSSQRKEINGLIEKAILEAEDEGVKVISLGLLNQDEELNRGGEVYVEKHPKLKIKIVDGSSLAAAVVVNSIPQGIKQVLLRGKPVKMASSIALALCQRGVEVIMVQRDEFENLKLRHPSKLLGSDLLVLSNSYTPQVWLVGDGLTEEEHRRAPKGTKFIPFTHFLLKNLNKDCIYYSTPAMKVPKYMENMHCCENWLPRRVMSACRVAGIVHALEGWNINECGDTMFDLEKVWEAALYHGFLPV